MLFKSIPILPLLGLTRSAARSHPRSKITFPDVKFCRVTLNLQIHFKHHITYRLGRVLGQKLAFCLVQVIRYLSDTQHMVQQGRAAEEAALLKRIANLGSAGQSAPKLSESGANKGPKRGYYPYKINHQNGWHFPILVSTEVWERGLVFLKTYGLLRI